MAVAAGAATQQRHGFQMVGHGRKIFRGINHGKDRVGKSGIGIQNVLRPRVG